MPLQTWNELLKQAQAAGSTGSFEPLPAGKYDAVIEEATYRQSSGGKDGYNVRFVIESGPYEGRKTWNTFYVSPESPTAMGIFFRHMDALGVPDTFFALSNPTHEQICAALTGKRAVISLKIKNFNNKDSNEVTDVSAPADGVQSSAAPTAAGAPSMVPQVPQTPAAQPQTPQVPQTPAAQPQVPQYTVPATQALPATPPADPWAATPPPVPPLG